MRSLVLAAGLAAAPAALALPQSQLTTSEPGTLALEALLPDDVFAFASFAGLDAASEAAEELELFKLIEEPEVQYFLSDMIEEMQDQMGSVPQETVDAWDTARRQLGGRISVAVGDLTLVWTDEGPIPLPGVILALDVGSKRMEVSESLDMLIGLARAEAGEELAVSSRTRGDHEVTVLELGGASEHLEVHVAFIENLLLASLNGNLLDRCIDAQRGAVIGGTLDLDPAFTLARGHAAGWPMVELYIDTAELHDRVQGLLPVEVKQVLHDLGLDAVGSLYYASTVLGGDSVDTLFVGVEGERRGLLAIGGDRPVDDRALALVPESAVYFTALSLDPAKVWDTVMGVVDEVAPPEALAQMNRELAMAESELGFSIRDGLLAALGDEFVAYVELPDYGFVPGVVVSVELRDRAEAARILGTALGAAGASVRQVPFGERALYVIRVPEEELPVSPCFTFEGDRLVLGLTTAALEDALTGIDQGRASIVDSENFQDALHLLDRTDAASIEYLDLRTLTAFGYDLAVNLLPAFAGPDLPVDFALLPAQETLTGHLNGLAGVVRTTESGILMQSRSPSIASLVALAVRGLDEIPGGPLAIVAGGEQYEYGYEYDFDDEVSGEWAGDWTPPPAVTPAAPEAVPAPAGLVNPVSSDDPRVAEFRAEVEALTAAIEQDPKNGELYFNRGIRSSQLSQYERAIKDYQISRELGFREATCAYNLACVYSLSGDVETAFEWLETGFEEGFSGWAIVAVDTDIDALRGDDRFAALVAVHKNGDL